MIGSSETTREPPPSSFDFTDFIEHHLVQHKRGVDQAFLEWLIGLVEGDGTFCSREIPIQQARSTKAEVSTSGPHPRLHCLGPWEGPTAEATPIRCAQPLRRRLLFQIVQKDPKVLHRVRSELGFGMVRQSGDEDKRHWRYTVEDRRGLQRIMALFNGNLVLPKRRHQFAGWVNDAREILWPSFVLKGTGPVVSLNTGWLSGFIDAEGCFYAHFTTPSQRSPLSYRLIQKVHIIQQDRHGETEVLRQIGQLMQSRATVRLVKPPDSYRLEISCLDSHQVLVEYLQRFPLRGKAVVFRQWWRIYLLRVEGRHLHETGIRRMRRLCLGMRRKGKEGSG